MKKHLLPILLCFFISCNKKPTQEKPIGKNQDEILNTYLKNGAWKHHYTTKEWDEWINKGLKQDSTIAYLWQQRAMPLWKQKKYQLAISYFDKAVALDRKKWLSRLGFLKCIFAKDYNAALKDLTTYKQEFGSTYEQDHSLEFYIGLCYLQLNHYDKALVNLQESVNYEIDQHGENWVHYLDRFYLAIAFYELGEYKKAILEFDKVLKQNGKKVIFIRLLGTHFDYKNRYPFDFNKFSKIGGSFKTEIKNQYDNAVFYNDFIVYSIIKKLKGIKGNNALLYTSDHGENVFDDGDFFGRNEANLTKSMFEIPFFIWTSDSFELPKDFQFDSNRKFMTDHTYESLGHLLGVKHKDMDFNKSIFSKSFKERERNVVNGVNFDTHFFKSNE